MEIVEKFRRIIEQTRYDWGANFALDDLISRLESDGLILRLTDNLNGEFAGLMWKPPPQ